MKRFMVVSTVLVFSICGCVDKDASPDSCGDGIVDVGEVCDGINLGGKSCEGEGYFGGDLVCAPDCTLNISGCNTSSNCGNGVVQTDFNEECEDGVLGGETCTSLGYYSGDISCGEDCKYDISNCERCGDGTVQSVETCDGSNLNGETCNSIGYDGGELKCDLTSSCGAFDESDCYRCGDGNIDPDEECDGSELNGETCVNLGLSDDYPLYCDSTCHFAGCESFPKVSTGLDFTCYLSEAGNPYCWGTNTVGQLGDNTLVDHFSPEPVDGNHQFSYISSGAGHVCSITDSQLSYCWGSDFSGQLGNNTSKANSLVPALVYGSNLFTDISSGALHTCALDSSGAAYCWGSDAYGQLGDSLIESDSSFPVPVAGNHIFYTIATRNNHTCGITTSDETYCWGANSKGQTGADLVGDKYVPVLVTGGHDFVVLTTGNLHGCGITASGAAYCWGANDLGQLGDGTLADRTVPTLVDGSHEFIYIAGGVYHTCGITSSGETFCWGGNVHGQLGDGSNVLRAVPTLVRGSHLFIAVSPGSYHTCGVTLSGELYCWGENRKGQLGDNTTVDSFDPILIIAP